MRTTIRSVYSRALLRAAPPLGEDSLSQPALILAPHQDDETLGCGGTILRKRQLGAPVRIVFMTDGTLAQSHTGLKQDMAAIRRREALQAASMLGVSGDDVQFLGFRDGALAASEKQAVDFLRSQLEEFRPKQVFVPHRLDANVDHQATFRIGMAALSVTKVLAQVFEYPVWFWYHWPWVPISLKKRRGARKILKNSIHYRFGLQVVRSFNCRVSIENQQDAKRAALWAHQSQTTQLVPDPNWLTLGDIAQGQFLERFFQPYELFAHSRHIPA